MTNEEEISIGTDDSLTEWSKRPDELARVAEMHEWQLDAERTVEELARGQENFGYWRANAATRATLWCLILLDDGLSVAPPVSAFADPAKRLHAILPFDDVELRRLAGGMKGFLDPAHPEDSSRWYQAALDEDILALDRWRRWLDREFNENFIDDADRHSQAVQLFEVIAELGRLFPQK